MDLLIFFLMCECWKPVGRWWTPSIIYAQLLRMLNSEPRESSMPGKTQQPLVFPPKSQSFLFNCPLTAFSERNLWLLEPQTRGNLFLAQHWLLLHKNKLSIQRDCETAALLYSTFIRSECKSYNLLYHTLQARLMSLCSCVSVWR